MRRYLLIAIVAMFAIAMIGLGTFAWFSDTEVVTGTFTSGVIELEVNVPIDKEIMCEDMKPCDWFYKPVQLAKTLDSNEGPVWLHIDGIAGPNPGLASWITFDLSIDGEVVIDPDDHMKITDLKSISIPLGWLTDTDPILDLELSFHLEADTPNSMQGKSCSVIFEFIMTDHNAPPPTNGILLENKDTTTWDPILGDGIWGTCRYDVSSLNLDVMAKGLTSTTIYQVGITSPEDQTWYPTTQAERESMASALASGVYASGGDMGTAPPGGFNLYERGYCAIGGTTLHDTYAADDVGVYTFTNSGSTLGGELGSALAAGVSKSCSLPSGAYKYIKVLIKEDSGTYPVVLMEKDTNLFFTIP
jgi:predicted ribosomally synthesized peptide with SipW-like signal peptide